VHEVGVLKKRDNVSIYAPEREEQLLRSLNELNERINGRLPASAVRAIYREIMSASFALEKGLTIAYLGPEATWSHQAAREKIRGERGVLAAIEHRGGVQRGGAREGGLWGGADREFDGGGGELHTGPIHGLGAERVCAVFAEDREQPAFEDLARPDQEGLYASRRSLGSAGNGFGTNLPDVELIEVSSTTRAAELASKEAGAAAIAGGWREVYGLEILETRSRTARIIPRAFSL